MGCGEEGEAMADTDTWLCRRCGEAHGGLPFSYGVDAPEPWYEIPPRQRRRRAVLSRENCEIDGERFFLRGRILIPVHGADGPFDWGAWVSVDRGEYERALSLWGTCGREGEPLFPGRLATDLPYEPPTMGLEVLVRTRPVGERPVFELVGADHPLALEQGRGIPLARVREIAGEILHG